MEENCKFEELSDEVLLKVLNYLEVPDLIRCSGVSRRIRSITYDHSLWLEKNFSKTWVWIHGLVKSPALNGKLGKVVGFDTGKNRLLVFIPDFGLKSDFDSNLTFSTFVQKPK